MIIYYSGKNKVAAVPEALLGREANIMLSFCDTPRARFKRLLKRTRQGEGVTSHFLDSGAFTLWSRAQAHGGWKFYETDEHWEYLDQYVQFVEAHRECVNECANVDVIPDPECDSFNSRDLEQAERLTLRNQEYLEDKGLFPVPVVHYRVDLKWLTFYIEKGYQYVALGGLVGSLGQDHCRGWLDKAFDIICQGGEPIVRVHGFGVVAHRLLVTYPWYSVDSTAWIRSAGSGSILVPQYRSGVFRFLPSPYIVPLSQQTRGSRGDRHYERMAPAERRIVDAWLDEIGIDRSEAEEDYGARCFANLKYYERLRVSLPQYPWAYRRRARPNFGFV